MRPERLTMQAFGPFSNRETIDFMKLEGRTMFVVSGNTGAGKTTIFDALTFALYGETSGGEREMNDLRSHFAADTVKTEVEVEFSLKGERYLIWRQPTQPHPKNKTGYAHEAIFSRFDGTAWKPLATKIPEVKMMIGELLQLDHKQFSQILLLPQNKFRELLIAESKDKLKILKQLFKTEQYGDFQSRLNRKALDLKAKIQQTKTKQLAKLEELPLSEVWEELSKDAVLQRFGRLSAEWDAKLVSLRSEETVLLEVLQRAENAMRTAETIEAVFRELELAEESLRSLEEVRPEMDEKRVRLDEAVRAARIEPIHVRLKDDSMTLERLKARRESLEKDIERLESDRSKLSESVRSFEEAAPAFKSKELRGERLLQLIEEESERSRLRKESLRLSEQSVRLDPSAMKTEREKAQKIILDLKKDHSVHRDVQDKLLRIKEESFTARQAEQLVRKKMAVEQEIAKLVERGRQVRDEKAEAEKALQDAIHAERIHLASTLAGSLNDGDPCPVCGSADHPRLAQAIEQNRIPADQLQRVFLEKHSAHQELQMNYKSLTTQLQELEAEFTETANGLPPEQESLREIREKLAHDERRLLEQAAEKRELEQRIETMEQQMAEFDSRITTNEAAYQKTVLELSRVEERLSSMDRPGEEAIPLDEMRSELEHLKNEIVKHADESERAKKAYESAVGKLNIMNGQLQMIMEETIQADTKYVTSKERFDAALKEEAFKDETAFTAACISRADRERIEEELRAHDERYSFLCREIERLGKLIQKEERPELETLKGELVNVKSAAVKATDSRAGAEKEYDQILQLIRAWKALQQEIDTEDARYAVLGDLADAGMGGNAQRMTFETYVQTAYFDEILHAANRHLVRMTSGRFQLERKKEAGNKKKTHGLDLDVFDAYTSQTRHVKTLSGGESFKASLALALGLSEVVQEASGGVSLETMFIDEGFGTLDPESLEQAIETLLSVQASGRMVGVISHVAELKSRVDARIEVRQEKTGSTIEVVLT